jgi:hypothetical protein
MGQGELAGFATYRLSTLQIGEGVFVWQFALLALAIFFCYSI